MKSKLKLFMAMLAAVLCFGTAVACDEPADPPAHEHTYATEWTTDETHHWHAATCEHTDEVKDKAEHTLTETVITQPTYQAKGSAKKVCSCGYETAAYELEKLAKLDPTYTVPTGLVGYFGETLADITLPEGFSFVDEETTEFDEIGEKTFKVTYTAPNDTEGKYNVITNIEVTITVNKARPEYTVPTELTAEYGSKLSSIAFTQPANGNWTWNEANTTLTTCGEQKFVATFTPSSSSYATVDNVEITVTVTPKTMDINAIGEIVPQTYTGNPIQPTLTVMDGSIVLELDEDYTVEYSNQVNAGTATAKVVFINNYTGEASKTYTINKKQIPTPSDPANKSFVYDGTVKTFAIEESAYYTVSGANQTNAGTYDVTVTLNNSNVEWNGGGSDPVVFEDEFVIAPYELKASDLQVSGITGLQYNGQKQTPTATVTAPILESDYTLTNNGGTNAGGYTVTLASNSANVIGEAIVVNYTIAPKTLTSGIQAIAAQTYTGDKLTPAITIKDGETTLNAGADYETPVYGDNVTVAQGGSVSVELKGNYAGTLTAQFVISPAVLDATAIGAIDDVTFNNEAQEPDLDVNFGTTPLALGTDYDVTYANNTNAGEASATVAFKGNFDGDVTVSFNILKKDITAEMITVTGSTAQLTNGAKPEVTVSLGATADDFTLSYANNLYAGDTATVTVTANAGSVNFTGSAEKTFTVTPFAGATAKTMNAEVSAIDAYKGQLMEVRAVDETTYSIIEDDDRGLWYKAELTEDGGMYVVAKAVADNYVYDNRYDRNVLYPGLVASEASPQTRRTYFEISLDGSSTKTISRYGTTEADVTTIVNGLFDFVIWRTIENTGVTTGGKYTHVMEGYIPASKVGENKSIAIAYSSAIHPVMKVDGTTGEPILNNNAYQYDFNHIEEIKTNNALVNSGYIFVGKTAKALNPVTLNGIKLNKIDLQTYTHDGTTSPGWQPGDHYGWTETKENLVLVLNYGWNIDLYDTTGAVYTGAAGQTISYDNTYTHAQFDASTGINFFVGYRRFKNKTNANEHTELAGAVEFTANGVKADGKSWAGTDNRTGNAHANVSANKELGVTLFQKLKNNDFKVVVVREGAWISMYLPVGENGAFVCSKNPIGVNDNFFGALFRKWKHSGTVTASASVVYGTTDYERVLSTYYAD